MVIILLREKLICETSCEGVSPHATIHWYKINLES